MTRRNEWRLNIGVDPRIFGGLTILVTVFAFITWSALAPLHGAIVGAGLVKPEGDRRIVQHAEGGIIKQIYIHDGDAVIAGQRLIELENVSIDSTYALLKEMVVNETLKRDRLDAEQQFAESYSLDRKILTRYGANLVEPAYQRERKIFESRRYSLNRQLDTLAEQRKAIRSEHTALRQQIEADHESIRLVESELQLNRRLEAEKFVARARLLTYERAAADYRSELAEHEAALAQTDQRSNDVKLRAVTIRSEYQRQASEEYKESCTRLAEYRERLRPAEDALRRKVVVAPVSGKVVGLRFYSPGQVAGPREVLLEIVPDAEDLLIEAKVSVDGIKELHAGQEAGIRFTAYKQRTTPIVKGDVAYISADALEDKNGAVFYQVHIRPDPASLGEAGIDSIQSGMAAEVFILTEARTTLDYLLSPIFDTIRRSMREK